MKSVKVLSLFTCVLIFISAQAHPFLDGRMLTPSSSSMSPTTLASSGSSLTDPQLATLTNTNIVLAYISGGNSIKLNIYSAYGLSLTSPTGISAAASTTIASVAVAALSTGGFVVVYEQQSSLVSQIFYQTYTASGSAGLPNTQVLTATFAPSIIAMNPKVAGLSNGYFAITFLLAQAVTLPTHAKGIYATVYDGTGMIQLSITPVNSDPLSSTDHYPAIAAKTSGGFIITFHNMVGSNIQIYAKIYSSNSGSASAATFAIAQPTYNDNTFPCIASTKTGGFVIVFSSNIFSSNQEIYSSTYDSTGTLITSSLGTMVSTDMNAYNPSVVITGNSMTISAWIHKPSSGSNLMYLTSNDANLTMTYLEGAPATSNYVNPNAAVALTAGSTGFFAVWSGTTTAGSSTYSIYGYAFNNYGDKTSFSGNCFDVSDCSSSTQSCLYNARTCGTCQFDTDCPTSMSCYQSVCQNSLNVLGNILGGAITAAAGLLWWIILLIVLGVVLCLVITGCIIWRLCRRSPTRTIVVKQTPQPQLFVPGQQQGYPTYPNQSMNVSQAPMNYNYTQR